MKVVAINIDRIEEFVKILILGYFENLEITINQAGTPESES